MHHIRGKTNQADKESYQTMGVVVGAASLRAVSISEKERGRRGEQAWWI